MYKYTCYTYTHTHTHIHVHIYRICKKMTFLWLMDPLLVWSLCVIVVLIVFDYNIIYY